jgi:ABC-2 type transport system permease protein
MKILTIALKDLKRNFRSPFAVGMMFIAPLLIGAVMALAFGGMSSSGSAVPQIQELKVGIVNLDQAVSGVRLGDTLKIVLTDQQFAGFLKVVDYASEEEARAALQRREVGVILIIPADFSQAGVALDRQSTITLIKDPTLTMGPAILKNILSQYLDSVSGASIAANVTVQKAAEQGVTLDAGSQNQLVQRITQWFANTSQVIMDPKGILFVPISPDAILPPKETPAASGAAPANLGGMAMVGQIIFFAFYTAAFTAMGFLKEDEEKTLPRLFTTPTPRSVILAGRFVAIFLMVIVQATVLIFIATLVFKINWGDPLLLLLSVSGMIITAAGFGLFIISLVKTTRAAGMVLGGVLATTGMLGGLYTGGVPNMPEFFTTLSTFLPQGCAMQSMKAVISGQGFNGMLPYWLGSLAFGIVLFAVGAVIFRKRYS